MSKLIVVTGVTGIQGSSVAKTFLETPDWRVRGITRDPTSASAVSLAQAGVELMQGDLDDVLSLQNAFQGANAIFANTDFFQHFFHGLQLGDPSPLQHAFNREVEQGVNIAQAAASPTILQTLNRFVVSSLVDARKWSKGKFTEIYHFDSKAETIRLIRQRFSDVAARMSLLQVGHYVTNWKGAPELAPQKQDDGSYIFRRPFSPDFVMPFIVPHEDTGPYVRALVNDLPAGTHVAGVSQNMTHPEFARLWGETLGVKASYEQVSPENFFAGSSLPPVFQRELRDSFLFAEEFGFTGGDADVKSLDQLGIRVPLTSMKEYFEQEDWSSVL